MKEEKNEGLLSMSFTFILLHKQLMIKYFNYSENYKHYCQSGKIFRPDKLDICPFCGRKDSLNHHGHYKRKELVTGYDKRYGSFRIYRFLCKHTGQTIQMIPNFVSSGKRFFYLLLQDFLKNTSLRIKISICFVKHMTFKSGHLVAGSKVLWIMKTANVFASCHTLQLLPGNLFAANYLNILERQVISMRETESPEALCGLTTSFATNCIDS